MNSDDYASDPSAQNSALLPSEQQMLNEARRLMENGKTGQAAPLFSKLAEVLTSAKQPRRAANLHAEASQAFAQSHNEAPALAQARLALNMFLHYEMAQRAAIFYAAITRELNKRGLKNAADTLAKEYASRIQTSSHAATHLPTTCPQCGAPVRSDEVHWIDDSTAECNFCGASIRSAG